MAPKKVGETAALLEIPDQPPSIESDGVMGDLLAKARFGNVAAVEALLVQCLRLPNYRCDLQQSVVVDFHVEIVLFAAENGYGPRKTLLVMSWMNELRKSIEEQCGDDAAAKVLFKSFLVANVERYLRDGAHSGGDGADAHETSAAPPPAAPAAGKAPPGGGKDAKAKGSVPAPVKEDPAASRVAAENPNISTAEVGPLANFVSRGLLQHAQLYAYVARCQRPVIASERPRSFTFAVETAMRAPSLGRALTAADVEALQKDKEAKSLEELHRLQQQEAAALEEERLAEAAKQEALRLLEEEEKANQLYFSKAGSAPAVEMVQQEVVSVLSQRQRDILTRIARLEMDMNQVMGK